MRYELFGVEVTNYNGFKLDLSTKEIKFVSTLNAELLLLSRSNSKFKKILNQSITTLDGTWTYLAFIAKYRKKLNVIKESGADLIYSVVEKASHNNLKIMILGGSEESNNKAVRRLSEQHDYSSITGYSPSFEDYPFSELLRKEIILKVREVSPDIIITAFGVPKQEFWAMDSIQELQNIGVRYVFFLGGATDMVAGLYKRAPRIIQNVGLESLWRLVQNPQRWRREIRKIKFLVLILFWRM